MKVSLIVPIYDMQNGAEFLWRNICSIAEQSYTDYEIIISKTGHGMAGNSNDGMKRAKGELIKILFQDDCFSHTDALKDMVDNFKGGWLMTGTQNNSNPHWTRDILTGNNKLGSPSALLFENNGLMFDETMQWLIDCDFYWQLFQKYGEPTICPKANVELGLGKHQITNQLSESIKRKEFIYLRGKWLQ